MDKINQKLNELLGGGEDGHAYGYGGGGLLVIIIIVILLIWLL
jgi:hypothetical protein